METIDFKRLNTILRNLKSSGIIYNDTDFCNRTGITKSFLSEMKNGKKQITEKTVRKISETLNINILWLLTGEGEMLKNTSIDGDSIIQTGEGHNAVINKNKYSGKFAGIPEGTQLQYLMEQNRQLLQQNQKFQDHIDRLLGIIEDMSKK